MPPDSPVIHIDHLTKRFGSVLAVDDVSFDVDAGEVFGLLGPNGAGKTTTLRMLATLLDPDEGGGSVAGYDIRRDAEGVRRSIGVVNGGMGLYDRLTGREILHHFGRLYAMPADRIETRIAELDDLLDLGTTLERQAGGYSTGMKQKIVIARAVLHDPPVIVFDEATSGLDVMARRAVLDFVRAYPSAGRAVVWSTHVMSEAAELCDRIAVLYKGARIADDSPDALLAQTDSRSLEEAFFRLVQRVDRGEGRAA